MALVLDPRDCFLAGEPLGPTIQHRERPRADMMLRAGEQRNAQDIGTRSAFYSLPDPSLATCPFHWERAIPLTC